MSTKTKANEAKLTPKLARDIAASVGTIELSTTSAWSALDALSHQTQIEGIEAFEDDIIFDPKEKTFRGHLTVYVTLNYGSGADRDEVSEGFPGTFQGRIKDGKPHVENVEVDTSSFYE